MIKRTAQGKTIISKRSSPPRGGKAGVSPSTPKPMTTASEIAAMERNTLPAGDAPTAVVVDTPERPSHQNQKKLAAELAASVIANRYGSGMR